MLKYPPAVPIWILSNPRVGSSYMCSLLNSTGICPRFDEYCQPRWWDDKYLVKPPIHNKIHFSMFWHFKNVDLESLLPGIKYVLLRRNDFVATAVSHYLARKLQQFSVSSNGWLNTGEVEYDEEVLLELYWTTKHWHTAYNDYLSTREYFELEYEELVADPIGMTKQILEFSNHQGDVNTGNVIVKMEHPQKEEFIRRLRSKVG